MTIPAAASTAPAPRTAGESAHPTDMDRLHLRFVFTEEGIWGKETENFPGKSFTLPSPNLPAQSPAFPLQKRSSLRIPCSRLSRVLEAAETRWVFLPSCAIPAGRAKSESMSAGVHHTHCGTLPLVFFYFFHLVDELGPAARLQARHSWACRRDQASHRRYSARRSPTSPQKARHR